MSLFVPEEPLIAGPAAERCKAVVIVPARNEQDSLSATLNALAGQQDLQGRPLDSASFEVLLLLNNCTDGSAAVARAWQAEHPDVLLHIAERTLPAEHAHVGKARRLLMDTAWARLHGRSGHGRAPCGILSTDSDTIVSPDWIAQTLRALQGGADAVGGVIDLKSGELERLPKGAQTSYLADREYQSLFAELEDRLDPQAGDPWPRHLEHFGASLACTPAAYEAAGGVPPVNSLEDMAFVDQLFRMDARLRHEPAVKVSTSARFEGRASLGLSWQLRTWQRMYEAGQPHRVPNSSWLQHRFRSLRFLREVHWSGRNADLSRFAQCWQKRIREALAEDLSTGEFLGRIDCDSWIAETYSKQESEGDILRVNRNLRSILGRKKEPSRGRRIGRPDPLVSGPVIPGHAAADRRGSGHVDAR